MRQHWHQPERIAQGIHSDTNFRTNAQDCTGNGSRTKVETKNKHNIFLQPKALCGNTQNAMSQGGMTVVARKHYTI
eukprot:2746791-Amphidinium_carterae.2